MAWVRALSATSEKSVGTKMLLFVLRFMAVILYKITTESIVKYDNRQFCKFCEGGGSIHHEFHGDGIGQKAGGAGDQEVGLGRLQLMFGLKRLDGTLFFFDETGPQFFQLLNFGAFGGSELGEEVFVDFVAFGEYFLFKTGRLFWMQCMYW